VTEPSTVPRIPPLAEELGVHPVFFALSSEDSNYVKIVIESYDCIGVLRCQDPDYRTDRILLVLLLVPDMVSEARALLGELCRDVEIEFPEATPEMLTSLSADLLSELTDTACQTVE